MVGAGDVVLKKNSKKMRRYVNRFHLDDWDDSGRKIGRSTGAESRTQRGIPLISRPRGYGRWLLSRPSLCSIRLEREEIRQSSDEMDELGIDRREIWMEMDEMNL